MYNVANTGLIIKNCIATNGQDKSYSTMLSDIYYAKRPIMSLQACLGDISNESHDLGYCQNDTPDSLICNSYLERFKLNTLYIQNLLWQDLIFSVKEEKVGQFKGQPIIKDVLKFSVNWSFQTPYFSGQCASVDRGLSRQRIESQNPNIYADRYIPANFVSYFLLSIT